VRSVQECAQRMKAKKRVVARALQKRVSARVSVARAIGESPAKQCVCESVCVLPSQRCPVQRWGNGELKQ